MSDLTSRMANAMQFITDADHGKVAIRKGKKYPTVALRVEAFRRFFPEMQLLTEIVENDGEVVIVRATISRMAEVVVDSATVDLIPVQLATGHAEEVRGSSQVNRTSALENCETSAIGRALAAFGLVGEEMASANEVEAAIAEQAKPTINADQHDKLIQLLTDGGLNEEQIGEYRRSLRIANWMDLTVERFDRIYAKMEAKLAREYAEGEAAADAAERREVE